MLRPIARREPTAARPSHEVGEVHREGGGGGGGFGRGAYNLCMGAQTAR